MECNLFEVPPFLCKNLLKIVVMVSLRQSCKNKRTKLIKTVLLEKALYVGSEESQEQFLMPVLVLIAARFNDGVDGPKLLKWY